MAKKSEDKVQQVLVERKCEDCVHWSRHECVDESGKPIKRKAVLAEPVWYYQVCKKNWGLPSSAFINASKCQFYRTK